MELENSQLKERHGCVSAWLILIIVVNSATILVNIFAHDMIAKSLHYPSKLIMIFYGAMAIINILFAAMLLKWKKWAFWGFTITGLFGAALNFYIGTGIFASLIGLLGIPILYGILQIKKDQIAAWNNLE